MDSDKKSKISGRENSELSSSIINLSKNIVGTGILTLPSSVAAFSDSPVGAIVAGIIVSIVGYIAGNSFASIGLICNKSESSTFSSTWMKSTASSSANLVAAVVTANTFFSCLASSIVIGDSCSSLFRYYGVESLGSRPSVILLFTATIIWPLCLLRKLDALKYTSFLGIVGSVYCAVFVAIRYWDGSYSPGGYYHALASEQLRPHFGSSVHMDSSVFKLFTTSSSAFLAHYNAPRMLSELKRPTVSRFNFVVFSAFMFATTISIFTMLVGYLTFGGNSAGLILNNYSVGDPLAVIARACVSTAILCGYPLAFSALREGLCDLMKITATEKKENLHFSITTILVVVITACSIFIEDVSLVVSVSGALFGTMLIYIFPAYMTLKMKGKHPKDSEFSSISSAGQFGTGLFGCVVAIVGVYSTLSMLMHLK